MAVHEQSVYLIEGEKVTIRTFQVSVLPGNLFIIGDNGKFSKHFILVNDLIFYLEYTKSMVIQNNFRGYKI